MPSSSTLPVADAAFSPGQFVVYPAHGVAQVVSIETQRVGNEEFKVLVVTIDADRLVVSVPLNKVKRSGLRRLSSRKVMQSAFTTMKGRANKSRGLWSRRAIDYASKIKSGDLVTIAEVVRDLYRRPDQPERSYSERLIFEQAFDRLAREVAAIEETQVAEATTKLAKLLDAA
jgi:CarD family transcriptional regulator